MYCLNADLVSHVSQSSRCHTHLVRFSVVGKFHAPGLPRSQGQNCIFLRSKPGGTKISECFDAKIFAIREQHSLQRGSSHYLSSLREKKTPKPTALAKPAVHQSLGPPMTQEGTSQFVPAKRSDWRGILFLSAMLKEQVPVTDMLMMKGGGGTNLGRTYWAITSHLRLLLWQGRRYSSKEQGRLSTGGHRQTVGEWEKGALESTWKSCSRDLFSRFFLVPATMESQHLAGARSSGNWSSRTSC